ncbi:hypothetical protein HT031_000331 [Scenedesmus sp. PABB004]|nr:hypothetical protein HT031_000331 [Scenedesmus sp. PABB004]
MAPGGAARASGGAARPAAAPAPCTLKELCPEDKQKVAKLVKQVVELGKENARLQGAAGAADDKVRQIQECNREAVRENCSLKTKLGQAVTVLRMYHHKVQGLDAALRALQHAPPPLPAPADDHQQQQGALEGRAQAALPAPQHEAPPPQLPPPPRSPERQEQAQQPEEQAQQALEQAQQPQEQAGGVSPGSVTSAPPRPAASQAAARPQSAAQQLPDLAAHSGAASPAPAAVAAAGCALSPSAPTSARAGSSASPSAAQSPRRPAALEEAVTPLVLPPLSAGVREALGDLARWQLAQGLITPGEAADAVRRRALQFDPAIGAHGAFVVQDLPAPSPLASLAPGGAAARAPAADWPLPQQQQHQHQPLPPQQAVQQQHQHQQWRPAPQLAPLKLTGGGGGGGGGGAAGLLEASAWGDSPTCKQLLDLAAAFDSLATAPTPGSSSSRSACAAGAATPAGPTGELHGSLLVAQQQAAALVARERCSAWQRDADQWRLQQQQRLHQLQQADAWPDAAAAEPALGPSTAARGWAPGGAWQQQPAPLQGPALGVPACDGLAAPAHDAPVWGVPAQPPAAGAGDAAAAAELLERFDASLVDLLAEVERLEVQQAAARASLRDPPHGPPPGQRRGGGDQLSCTGAPPPPPVCGKWPGWQQQERPRGPGGWPQREAGGWAQPGWGCGEEDDVSVVSDILNLD